MKDLIDFIAIMIMGFTMIALVATIIGTERLQKSQWECTAYDARDKSCVEYGLIEFPDKVEYKHPID